MDYYNRIAKTRQEINNWLEAHSSDSPRVDIIRYKGQRWSDFKSKLRDDLAPPNTIIEEKLREKGLREVNGDVEAL